MASPRGKVCGSRSTAADAEIAEESGRFPYHPGIDRRVTGARAAPFHAFCGSVAAMDDNTIEPFGFPATGRKKVAAALDGGRLTSDGGSCCWPRP